MRVAVFALALLALVGCVMSQSAPLVDSASSLLQTDAAVDSASLGGVNADFVISQSQLQAAVGCSSATAAAWLAPIRSVATKFGISTAKRMAGFLAQVGHESGSFDILIENLNYSQQGLLATFPKYFTSAQAAAYARQPQKIASRVYANRMGNGNEASGEGWKYRGRGLIQITGKDNYTNCGKALGLNLVANPDLLTERLYAAMSAGWFWNKVGLNAVADAGDLVKMTRLINGGTNGLDDRQARYNRAKKALGI